jgi:hypothetical protein
MNNPVQLFLKIIYTVSKGRIRPKPNSTIAELFKDVAVFGPLEYELCLYSLEATLKRKIADSFYRGGVEKDFETTIEDFIARYLRAAVSKDPVFVTRQFMKFAKSAKWEGDEKTEPGKN